MKECSSPVDMDLQGSIWSTYHAGRGLPLSEDIPPSWVVVLDRCLDNPVGCWHISNYRDTAKLETLAVAQLAAQSRCRPEWGAEMSQATRSKHQEQPRPLWITSAWIAAWPEQHTYSMAWQHTIWWYHSVSDNTGIYAYAEYAIIHTSRAFHMYIQIFSAYILQFSFESTLPVCPSQAIWVGVILIAFFFESYILLMGSGVAKNLVLNYSLSIPSLACSTNFFETETASDKYLGKNR
jgi:hypothetical protein